MYPIKCSLKICQNLSIEELIEEVATSDDRDAKCEDIPVHDPHALNVPDRPRMIHNFDNSDAEEFVEEPDDIVQATIDDHEILETPDISFGTGQACGKGRRLNKKTRPADTVYSDIIALGTKFEATSARGKSKRSGLHTAPPTNVPGGPQRIRCGVVLEPSLASLTTSAATMRLTLTSISPTAYTNPMHSKSSAPITTPSIVIDVEHTTLEACYGTSSASTCAPPRTDCLVPKHSATVGVAHCFVSLRLPAAAGALPIKWVGGRPRRLSRFMSELLELFPTLAR